MLTKDNCDWYGGYCLELGMCIGSAILPTFNVTPGLGEGTVVFQFLTGPPGIVPNAACVDFNRNKALLEAYVCYDYENKQQEFIELPGGLLQERWVPARYHILARLARLPPRSPLSTPTPTHLQVQPVLLPVPRHAGLCHSHWQPHSLSHPHSQPHSHSLLHSPLSHPCHPL